MNIFRMIAKKLSISKRFVGEEPFSPVTRIYNDVLKDGLEKNNIEVCIIPRLKINGCAVSASYVRQLLMKDRLDFVKSLVPEPTFRFFASPEGLKIINHMKQQHHSNG